MSGQVHRMTYVIGIDVGGTFTDIVVATADGTTIIAKAPTTPSDQCSGVLHGLARAAERLSMSPSDLLGRTSRIVHGTTVATNALLEGKTARVAMLTTEGHRDVIEMREGLKPDRYNLRMTPPAPLVPRRLRLPVKERVRADGSVEIALDTGSLTAAIERLRDDDIEAVAVCFLHSWSNAGHEHRAAEAVRTKYPRLYVTTSSEVLPQIKEFERFSTTVANAAVGPLIRIYLGQLRTRLHEAGFDGELLVILSHGGVASVGEATRLAAGTVLSGPAGGVAAAVAFARAGVAPDIIGFDMGGTSTDISVIQDGHPTLAANKSIAGARIALPSLDIVTLGAGGGSIGKLDKSGLLAVGPESAGAVPGPACYGQGGTEATVTDANLVLGYLDPDNFLRSRRTLDRGAADAVMARLASDLGIQPEQAAAGIHRVVNSRMADGVRIATVRRGIDPRGYLLLAFGGAAGLHVAAVAAELGISRVVVPVAASVFSAWGMLNTDLRVELSRGQGQTGGIDTERLKAAFQAMEREGQSQLAWFDGEVTLHRSADMRYGEQVFELSVPLDGIEWEATDLVRRLADRFHDLHEKRYTYALRDQEVVLVNARLSVVGRLAQVKGGPASAPIDSAQLKTWRRIFLGGWRQVPVFDFVTLATDQSVPGPAIIESDTTTVLVRPGDCARFDSRGWLDLAIDATTASA